MSRTVPPLLAARGERESSERQGANPGRQSPRMSLNLEIQDLFVFKELFTQTRVVHRLQILA